MESKHNFPVNHFECVVKKFDEYKLYRIYNQIFKIIEWSVL